LEGNYRDKIPIFKVQSAVNAYDRRVVIPLESGIQFCEAKLVLLCKITQVGIANWIPPFGGMTASFEL